MSVLDARVIGIALGICAVVILQTATFILIVNNEEKLIEREKIFQKWIFDSLYSIDHKVLLPEEHEKPMSNKKIYVYNPQKDPMSEFNGMKDDFYE